MQRFKDFNNPTKKFVGLFFDEQTNSTLKQWAISNSFDITKSYSGDDIDPNDFDFHTTIFFTTSEHSTPEGEYFIEPISLSVNGVNIFGTDKQIPVLEIELSHKLADLRYMYEREGFKDAWGEYKPHISISYNWSGNKSMIPIPQFPIIANRIVVQNQKQE